MEPEMKPDMRSVRWMVARVALGLALALELSALSAGVGTALAEPATGGADTVAANASPARALVAAQPRITTASFGDWTLRCERPEDAADGAQVCDVSQAIQDERQGVVAQVSLIEGEGARAKRILALVPSNITFASPMMVAAPEADDAALKLGWRHCMPIGCVADEELPGAMLSLWREQSGQGRLTYKDAGGRDVAVPVSFRGLAQALDALSQQSMGQKSAAQK